MKDKFKKAHMGAAYNYAELSSCNRKQVGCVIVKNDTPIAIGYNGTPPGEDNTCEGEDGLSKSNVIHAEDNALQKLLRSNESSVGAYVFVTLAPCLPCAIRLYNARVERVYYSQEYEGKSREGIEFLNAHGIKTTQLID